jgi:putative tryptophan/tyrosine transport system substrate-binding protein
MHEKIMMASGRTTMEATHTKFTLVVVLSMLAAPLSVLAQQAPKVVTIGWLNPATPAAAAHLLEALLQGLREHGHVEGKTFVLERRYADGKVEELPQLARELVRRKVDVIVTTTDIAISAAKQQTRTIPIVMANSTDPLGTGLVASLARPGGNVTGLTSNSPQLSGKRLELLKDIVPKLSRVAFLWNPEIRGAVLDYQQTEGAARSLGLHLQSIEATRVEHLDSAFSAITEQRAHALIVASPNPITFTNRARIVTFVQNNRLPSVYASSEYVDAGGLMAYGPNGVDLFRRAATFVVKILNGAKPADLPVEQPAKLDLVINLKAAKALGLTIPQALLMRADQVIE